MTALLALSFTLPFDHFFFLAALVVFCAPAAAFALFTQRIMLARVLIVSRVD
jgi:hypothetical protein